MRLEPEGAVSLLLLLLPASGNMLLWSLPLPLAQMEALAMFSDGLNNSRLVLLLHSLTMARTFGWLRKTAKKRTSFVFHKSRAAGAAKWPLPLPRKLSNGVLQN